MKCEETLMKLNRVLTLNIFAFALSMQASCGLQNTNSTEREADTSGTEASSSVSDEQEESLGLTQKARCSKTCNGVNYKLSGCWKHEGELFPLKCMDGGKSIEQWFGDCSNKSMRGVCIAWQRWTIKK